MKKLNLNWTVNQFMSEWNKEKVSFTYPIQREGNQWDEWQKSLLIHSLAEDFPVPSLYAVEEEIEVPQKKDPSKMKKMKVYQILDGKQRLTNIKDFINGDYFLHEATPPAVIDGETYELALKTYDKLDEVVRQAIQNFSLLVFKIEDATDDQIEDIFIRLNNGTPLSEQQKSKGKMGAVWAKKIQGLMSHNLIKEKSSFTAKQVKEAQHELTVMQAMMILDPEFEWDNIASNEVAKYAETFRGNDSKDAVVDQVKKAMDYLDLAFKEKESVLLRKINFPMTILTALKAIEMEVHPMRFSDWRQDFKTAIKPKKKKDDVYIATDYKKYGGAGSVKKDKTTGRINEMQKHLETYFKNNSPMSIVPVEDPKKDFPKENTKKETKKPVEPNNDVKKDEPKAPTNDQLKKEMKQTYSKLDALLEESKKKSTTTA